MSQMKVYKKGEFLFREGEKIQYIHVIQSGGVSLTLQRGKKNVDLLQVGNSQILGETALSGAASYAYSAMFTSESKVMEFPVDAIKQLIEGNNPTIKVIIKSLVDRLKQSSNEIKSLRMEKDTSACPEDQVAKIFGSIYHTVHHKGESNKKNEAQYSIEWSLLKQYSQRIFGESPKRLEQALQLLSKLKLASLKMGQAPDNPDGPPELQTVEILDLPALEAFFEFYQYYYFKGGRGDILRFDESLYGILSFFLKLAEPLEADRFGIISMDYTKVIEAFKTELGISLNSDHFTRLEQKGIFAKRAPRQDGNVVLQFELKEFQTTQKIWKVLREIDKWNEKGLVDVNEDEWSAQKKKSGSATISCPQCGAELGVLPPEGTTPGGGASSPPPVLPKFCHQCGAKLQAAA